jgi:hypothetical protein
MERKMSEEKISGETVEAAVQQDEVKLEAQPEQEEKEKMVPLSALQSERAQRQQKEQEAQMLRDNLALLQANMSQQQKPVEQSDDNDSDVLTVGEAKKFMEKFNKNYELSLDEMRMMQKHPDYQEVITKFLPEILKNNPRIQKTLRESQDYELAYYLAKNSDAYKETGKGKTHSDAEKIIKNAQKTGSLTSAGTASSITQTKRYKDMSDEEFEKEMSRNMGH